MLSKVEIFCCHAREDENLLEKLKSHLSPLQRQHLVEVWDNYDIYAGTEREQEIMKHLNNANVILLLISADFFSSETVMREMNIAIARHEQGEAEVIPIILRPVYWQDITIGKTMLSSLQIFPEDRRAITSWLNEDEAYWDVTENIDKVVKKLLGLPLISRSVLDNPARKKYLEVMRKRYGFIQLLVAPDKKEDFSFQTVFQPLKLRNRPLAAEDLERAQRRAFLGEPTRDENDPRLPLPKSKKQQIDDLLQPSQLFESADNGSDALQKSPQGRMIVLGGPGTGKSTVLRYLMDEACQKAQTDYTASLPIFISLAEYTESKKATLREYLFSFVEGVGIDTHYAETLWKAIEEQQAFICLDGLDEVAPGPREDVIRWINTEASGEKGNYWIVSSRFTEYKNGQFKHSQFTEWELQPLSHTLRLRLAHRLIPELSRLLSSSQEQIDPLLFVKTVETHAQAAAWGENPLLFSLAATVFVSKGVLPVSRAALYREVIESILRMREKDSVKRKTLWRVEADLALKLFEKNKRTFTLDDLLLLLSVINKEQNGTWDAEKIAKRIIVSGTVEVVARETYGFRHQTFQEYLAAVALSQQMIGSDRAHGEEIAWKMRTYSRWTEVLRLMVGELSQLEKFSVYSENEGEKAVQDWLEKLISQRATEEGDPGNLGLALVLKSLNEITEADWWKQTTAMGLAKNAITIWIDELFNSVRENQQGKRERLEALGQDVSYLPREVADETLKRLVQALRDPDRSFRDLACTVLQNVRQSPIELLVDTLGDSDASVRQAVVKVLGAQRKPVPLEPLLSALHDDNDEVRQAAREAFVKQGEYIPIEQLLEFLHTDDRIVQGAAIDALGERGENAPIGPLLSALHDKEAGLRGAVVRALAKLGDRVPIKHLLTFLQEKSDDDPSALFSNTFVIWNVASKELAEALAERGRQIPLEFLLDRLQNGAGYERIIAAQALADHRDEAILDPLIHIVRYDDFDQLQRLAVEALAKQGEHVPITFFVQLLQDDNINIQLVAIKALEERADPISIDPLLALLQDTSRSPILGSAIVAALGKLGDAVSAATFLALLRHEVPQVRLAAADIIRMQQERFSEEQLLEALRNEGNRRSAALQVSEKQLEYTPFKVLLSLIQEKNYRMRSTALHLLKHQADRVPRQLLLDLLYDGAMRPGTIEVLKQQKERIPVRLLMEFFDDQYVHGVILEELEHSSDYPKRIEGILAFLIDTDEHIRTKAIEILMRKENLPSPDSVYPFLYHKIDYVREGAVRILSELGEQIPLSVFLQVMNDPVSSVQYVAAEATLKRLIKQQIREGSPIPDEYIHAINDINMFILPTVIGMLWAEGENALLDNFLHLLRHKDHFIGISISIFLEDGAKRLPLDILLDLLNAEEKYIKQSAIQAIGKREDRSLIKHILPFLLDEDSDIKKTVLLVLGEYHEQLSIMQLLLPLLQDPNNSVRYEVIKLLEGAGEHLPVQQLLPLLHDSDNFVRHEALNALKGYLPQEDLLHLLYDDDSYFRHMAVTALGERGEDISQEYFLEALGDEDGSVRRAAIDVLSKRAPEVLARMNDEAITVLQGQSVSTLFESLSYISFCQRAGELRLDLPVLRSELTKLLNWPHWQVRISAAKALGSIRRSISNEAIRVLHTLRRQDPVHTVRKAADDALAEILSLETSTDDDLVQ